jgi:WD40 repeat protein
MTGAWPRPATATPLRVWDTTTPNRPTLWAQLTGRRSTVEAVAIDDAGTTVASGADDAMLAIWSLEPEQVAEWVFTTTLTPMTADEWLRYAPDITFRVACV